MLPIRRAFDGHESVTAVVREDELITGDEPRARVAFPELLDDRRALELPVLEREPQHLAQGPQFSVDGPVRRARGHVAVLARPVDLPLGGVLGHDVGRDRDEPPLREELVEAFEASFGLAEIAVAARLVVQDRLSPRRR